MASRTTVRLTPCSNIISASVGSLAPGLRTWLRVCIASASATSLASRRGFRRTIGVCGGLILDIITSQRFRLCGSNGGPRRTPLGNQVVPSRFPYQYSLSPPCIWRCVLAWLVITPNVVLLRLDCGEPKTTRLKRLNAPPRKRTRNRSVMRKGFARLTFSFKLADTRTREFLRGAFPRTPTGWAGNTVASRYLSLFGSKEDPERGARQL